MKKWFFIIRLGIILITPPFSSFFTKYEKFFKNRLAKNPNDRSSLWCLSNLYMWYKKYDEAKHRLELLTAGGEKRRASILLPGHAYYALKEYHKVEEILTIPKMLRDSDKETYYLGCSLIELGKFKKAAELIEKYTKHHQKNFLPYVHRGYAYFKAEMYDFALDSYLKAEKLNPTEKEIKESINICRQKISFH